MAMDDFFKLVDCVPTPIFVMDVTHGALPVYAHYNLAALEKTGRALEDIVGKTSIEVFGPEFGTAASEEQLETIASRKQRKYEYELPLKDEIRIVRTTLTPQFDAQGNVIRLIGTPIDVSIEWVAQNARQSWKPSAQNLNSLSPWQRMICARPCAMSSPLPNCSKKDLKITAMVNLS